MNWLLDDFWQEQFLPRFRPFPLSPPPRLLFRNNHSPDHTLFSLMFPFADRLSPTFANDDLLDQQPQFFLNGLPRLQQSPVIPNRQIKTFNRDYETLNCLGKGGYGHVFVGRRRSDNNQVVVKFLRRNTILNWGTLEGKDAPYEIEVLMRLRGMPGIIRIFEYYEEPDRFIFTMEKIPNSCTLFAFVTDSPSLENTELLRHIFREIIRLNVALQTYGVWHRDCKPENILFCKNDRSLRLIDFGSAAPVQAEDFHEFQGTLEIMVPEWILQKRYNGEKACVWTLGVCLYFLLFRQYPFRTKVEIVNGRSQLPIKSSTDDEAYQTMKQCLSGNEYRRPTLNDVQRSSWLE